MKTKRPFTIERPAPPVLTLRWAERIASGWEQWFLLTTAVTGTIPKATSRSNARTSNKPAPKPIGAAWLRFYYGGHDPIIRFELTRAT